jgi:sec-independent protein translocase protein TatA
MFGLGGQELLIIFLIVIVLFGGAKIPELLRGVGRGVGELQKGLEEGKRNLNKSIHEDDDRVRRDEGSKTALP